MDEVLSGLDERQLKAWRREIYRIQREMHFEGYPARSTQYLSPNTLNAIGAELGRRGL